MKICDFGLARVDLKESRKKTTVMTDYIATRWYRPPEIILSWKTIILSLLFSLVCQLGDIAVSYIKRKNRFKDTSDLLPGHGGLLDRIDGLIFVIIFSGLLKIFKVT